jgi:hypothetical protein
MEWEECQSKPKVSKRKGMIKIRAEINGTENKAEAGHSGIYL